MSPLTTEPRLLTGPFWHFSGERNRRVLKMDKFEGCWREGSRSAAGACQRQFFNSAVCGRVADLPGAKMCWFCSQFQWQEICVDKKPNWITATCWHPIDKATAQMTICRCCCNLTSIVRLCGIVGALVLLSDCNCRRYVCVTLAKNGMNV